MEYGALHLMRVSPMSAPLTPQTGALLVFQVKKKALVRQYQDTFDRVGSFLGRVADKVAIQHGWGPTNTTKAIIDILASLSKGKDGKENRVLLLGKLRDAFISGDDCQIPQLLKACHRLMEYALQLSYSCSANIFAHKSRRKETIETQLSAFKKIVFLTTNYPGLRQFFLQFKGFGKHTNTKAVVKRSWTRTLTAATPYRREWEFFYKFAVDCISGETATEMVEKCPIDKMGIAWENNECGLLGALLLQWKNCDFYEISGLIAMRYLGAILQLPFFWHKDNFQRHQYVSNRLFRVLRRFLEDIGCGCEGTLGSKEHVPDTEGADIVAHAVLQGVKKWSNFIKDVQVEGWKREFLGVIQLLLTSEARKFLRNSSSLAVKLFSETGFGPSLSHEDLAEQSEGDDKNDHNEPVADQEGRTISSSLGNLRLPRGKPFQQDPGPTTTDPIATMPSQVSLEDPSAFVGDEPQGKKSSNDEPDKPEIKLPRYYEEDGGGGSNNRERLHNVLKNAGFIENASYIWRYEVVILGGHSLHRAIFTFGTMAIQNRELKSDRASAKEATATLALPGVVEYIRSLPAAH
ncbi:hypothetical protein FRC17_010414 [Serendipita sp. 399]|nr:hypothetical protein FRC17_010414 [Serendipita sp. 399]